ncbi:DUF1493 family protein [Brevundimonas sp.]|uniref:DUF1493 family protein n=1 Tax=Brevundimonas sp. TaxID=1871086 RepID=UPI002FC66216
MSDARTAVLNFIEDFWRWKAPLADDADLFDVLGIEGDDAGEFMDAFVARFDVEAGNYRWYFHHGEEGWSIGALFYKPIHRRFGRMPITVAVLTEAVRTKRWPIAYPDHILPARRWDILINQFFAAGAVIGLGVWAWMRFTG